METYCCYFQTLWPPGVLQRFEKNDLDPDELFETKEDEELKEFFDAERLAGRIRNDDLAVLRIEINQRRMS